jgi:hypothetical protein
MLIPTMTATYPLYQTGSGLSDIGQVYRNPIRIQRGRGIGSVFAGLWKHIAPLAMSGLKTLGKQSLKTGTDMLGDLQKGRNIRDVLSEHGNLAAQQLAQKGINKLQTIRKKQTGKGILTHTTLGAIKAGSSRRNMLVGHSKRKRSVPRLAAAVRKRRKPRKTPVSLKRRRGRPTKKKSTQTGGRRKTTKRRGIVKRRRRKTARSIDIFDI